MKSNIFVNFFNKSSKGGTMAINFHSLLWSYSSRVPTILTTHVLFECSNRLFICWWSNIQYCYSSYLPPRWAVTAWQWQHLWVALLYNVFFLYTSCYLPFFPLILPTFPTSAIHLFFLCFHTSMVPPSQIHNVHIFILLGCETHKCYDDFISKTTSKYFASHSPALEGTIFPPPPDSLPGLIYNI